MPHVDRDRNITINRMSAKILVYLIISEIFEIAEPKILQLPYDSRIKSERKLLNLILYFLLI